MATQYATHFSTRSTPQSEPIPGKKMVPNSAGGFGFQIDDWKRLDRFLILGNDGGTYYASEKKLTIENAQCVLRCAGEDYKRCVDRIVEISDSGRAPKNDPAIFALALCAGAGSPECKAYALSRMPEVCRIGTHLFQFIEAVKAFRGWGRSLKRAVACWYNREDVAFQMVKYQQRNGVSHRDVLRLSHAGSNTPLYRWATGTTLTERSVLRKAKNVTVQYPEAVGELPKIIEAFEAAKTATTPQEICALIEAHNLPRECIPTQWLNEPVVWEALLQKMPLNALIRNLGKMTSVGLVKPLSDAVRLVTDKLQSQEYIRKSRLHPLSVLIALRTYAQGHGDKGKLKWEPVPQVTDALDDAFYLAFGNVETTGKTWMIGIDVSASMAASAGNTPISCCEAATALALVTAHVEPNYCICAFDQGVRQLAISKKTRLDDALKLTRSINGGGTDCSLPMLVALDQKLNVSTFCVLTDCETWAGRMHPSQALKQYRQKLGIEAKLIVNGMTATDISIADPSDFGMLDVVGFDTATPQLMADFSKA